MQPYLNMKAAAAEFDAAFDHTGAARPPQDVLDSLWDRQRQATREFIDWMPGTPEGAAAKLREAAEAMEAGGVPGSEDMAAEARRLADSLESGKRDPSLAHRLVSLLATRSAAVEACAQVDGRAHDLDNDAIRLLQSTIEGFLRPRRLH